MRAIAAVLVTAGIAHADPSPAALKDAETLISNNLAGVAAKADNRTLGFTKGAVVVLGSEDMLPDMSVWGVMYPADGKITLKPTSPLMADEGGDYVWFQLPFRSHVAATSANPAADKQHRLHGLAIKAGDHWELAGAHYADSISDAELLAPNSSFNYFVQTNRKPPITGDAKLAAAITSWFARGFVGANATKGTLLASGTSPTENATGTDVTKLVKTWDKLKLKPNRMIARTFLGGKVGFASVEVLWMRTADHKIRMMLTIAAVREGDVWKWTSLQFSP